MRVTMKDTVNKMVTSLIDAADRKEVNLQGLTKDNYNSFLDYCFNDGGETRCEKFCDLAWEYAVQFGELESPKFEEARWKCTEKALKRLQKRFTSA